MTSSEDIGQFINKVKEKGKKGSKHIQGSQKFGHQGEN